MISFLHPPSYTILHSPPIVRRGWSWNSQEYRLLVPLPQSAATAQRSKLMPGCFEFVFSAPATGNQLAKPWLEPRTTHSALSALPWICGIDGEFIRASFWSTGLARSSGRQGLELNSSQTISWNDGFVAAFPRRKLPLRLIIKLTQQAGTVLRSSNGCGLLPSPLNYVHFDPL
jgi:hypothetical protein